MTPLRCGCGCCSHVRMHPLVFCVVSALIRAHSALIRAPLPTYNVRMPTPRSALNIGLHRVPLEHVAVLRDAVANCSTHTEAIIRSGVEETAANSSEPALVDITDKLQNKTSGAILIDDSGPIDVS